MLRRLLSLFRPAPPPGVPVITLDQFARPIRDWLTWQLEREHRVFLSNSEVEWIVYLCAKRYVPLSAQSPIIEGFADPCAKQRKGGQA